MLPTLNKHIGDPPTKSWRYGGLVLSFATKYKYRGTCHLNIEAIFFAIG